jgi:hypothetical protein
MRLAQQDLANGNAASMIEWRSRSGLSIGREPSPAVPGKRIIAAPFKELLEPAQSAQLPTVW